MKSKLNRYLEACKKEARRYGIDPLFVRTEIYREPDQVEINYRSRQIRKRNKNINVIFDSVYAAEVEGGEKKGFVEPKEIVKKFEDSECYGIRLMDVWRGAGSEYMRLSIDHNGVADFEFDSEHHEGMKFLEEVRKNKNSIGPVKIIKIMVGIYALGIDRFKKAVESGEIVLPKKR